VQVGSGGEATASLEASCMGGPRLVGGVVWAKGWWVASGPCWRLGSGTSEQVAVVGRQAAVGE
jgi:hypothetical protein